MAIATLQDVAAIEAANPAPFETLGSTYELLAAGAAIQPEAPALSFFVHCDVFDQPARWTHREWLAEITRCANMLRGLGLQAGEVVAYVLPNLPESHMVIWGGETAGRVFAVNSLLEGEQMGELLRAADTRWLVTLAPTPDPEIWQRVETALKGGSGNLQGILAIDPTRHAPGNPAGSSRTQRTATLPEQLAGIAVLDFHVEMGRAESNQLQFDPPHRGEIASYFCTGGTTGLPKIGRHTHANETANAVQLASTLPSLFLPGKTTLSCLPLFHVNAQLGTGLAAFAHGAHVLLGPPAGYRSPGLIPRFWEIVAHHRVATFSGVPTVFAALLESPMDGLDLSCLDYAICGAAPMPAELLNTFERRTGMRVLEGYGLTESTCVASLTPSQGPSRAGSIGMRVPWEEMRPFILDEQGNYLRAAEIDEVGVIAIAGPNVFAGYLSDAHNASVWIYVPGDERRWLNTGDLARIDADGCFWLTGRKKELIIRGGHNIDPRIIEDAFAQHPAVAISAAVGRPDAKAGEVPVAYVQLQQPGSATLAELLEHAASSIPERAAIPREIRIVESLPLTAVGKTFKPALLMLEVESVVRAEAEAAAVELAALRVEQDPKLGLVAYFAVAQGEGEALVTRLGNYAFKSVREE